MDKKLLELLVCPVTKGPLSYGIPILLEHEARPLTDEELARPSAPAP